MICMICHLTMHDLHDLHDILIKKWSFLVQIMRIMRIMHENIYILKKNLRGDDHVFFCMICMICMILGF